MLRVWVVTLILYVNVIFQSTVLPYMGVLGVKPDTLMILVVSFALLGGNPVAPIVGFFGGLTQDILYNEILGIHTLQYMLIGYLIGLVYQKVYIGKFILPIFFVAIGNIMKELMMYIFVFFLRLDVPIERFFINLIIPEVLYTALITPVLYHLMRKLYKHKFMTKKWRFD